MEDRFMKGVKKMIPDEIIDTVTYDDDTYIITKDDDNVYHCTRFRVVYDEYLPTDKQKDIMAICEYLEESNIEEDFARFIFDDLQFLLLTSNRVFVQYITNYPNAIY